MIHAFDDEVAMTVGVKGAILLNHISWWIKKNEASQLNYHDGDYWTYNTAGAYAKLFPFWTETVVQKELRRLEKEGYLKGGCYNKIPTDRTKWYTLTDKGKNLCGCIPLDGGYVSASWRNGNREMPLSSYNSNKHTSNKHSNNARVREDDCSPELAEALTAFAEHRKKLRKPMTDYAKKLLLGKLEKLGKTDAEKVAILNQSIENGWQGVFPLGGERRQQRGKPSVSDMASDVIRMMDERGMLDDGGGETKNGADPGGVPEWLSE